MDFIKIDQNICTGCQECSKICPAQAIEGEHGKPQTINQDKCIKCGQCVQKCKSCITPATDGQEAYDRVKKERKLPDFVKEPLFAAHNVCHIDAVKANLANPSKICVVSAAPAVRVALGEDFGLTADEATAGKMAAALYALGFDHVYDVNFAADLTIMEEGTELISRITKGTGVLPMITSCCPGWVGYMEKNWPQLKDHLSTCKSPQQMQGAVEKTYGAEKLHVDGGSLYTVSIMPCTAKQFECSRDEMWDSGHRDIDLVLTTRELAYLIKDAGIDFASLEPREFESVMGNYTGAGAIFGVTGGVMEAAIRTGYELITGKAIDNVNVEAVRGYEGVRYSDIKAGDMTLKTCVVTGLSNVDEVLKKIEDKTIDAQFIEVMACPQGCISGGGQPKLLEDSTMFATFEARRKAIYKHDEELPLRKSHENPDIKKLYDEFLGEPNSEKAHHLLHTEYCIN